MYNFAKRVLSAIVPRRFRFKYEERFRWFYAVFYLGSKHQCTVCSKKLSGFVHLKNGERLCPFCGSLSRHRRLWQIAHDIIKPGDTLLHFSPARCLSRRFGNNTDITYLSSDFEGEFPADHHFDITDISLEDNSADVIICYHILEHIENDRLAIKELYRTLKPGSVAIVQTPFKAGEIYEDPSVVTPEERAVHFGQRDHVRMYSVKGLSERLKAANFDVRAKQYTADPFYGLRAETVLTATKNR